MTTETTKHTPDVLDSQEFYEVMQRYRHFHLAPQDEVSEAFEEVKSFVRMMFVRRTPLIAAATEMLAMLQRGQDVREQMLAALGAGQNLLSSDWIALDRDARALLRRLEG